MTDSRQLVNEVEKRVEKALWELELHDHLDEAQQVYLEAEKALDSMDIHPGDPAYSEQQRVLSYCLMRQGNILRQQGKPAQALDLSEQEVAAARACGDELTLARAVTSNGTNLIIAGKVDQGLKLIEEGRALFEKSDDYDHQQGLGWYWILQADLANVGLVKVNPGEVVKSATRALELLEPIENWPGVARAYSARAKAYEQLGEAGLAASDREAQKACESKSPPDQFRD